MMPREPRLDDLGPLRREQIETLAKGLLADGFELDEAITLFVLAIALEFKRLEELFR